MPLLLVAMKIEPSAALARKDAFLTIPTNLGNADSFVGGGDSAEMQAVLSTLS